MSEAMEAVSGATPEGIVSYGVVLGDGIICSQATNATVAMMYWIVTSDVPRDVSLESP